MSYEDNKTYDPEALQSRSISMKVKDWAKIDVHRGMIPTSPFVRKLIELALKEGLQDKIE